MAGARNRPTLTDATDAAALDERAYVWTVASASLTPSSGPPRSSNDARLTVVTSVRTGPVSAMTRGPPRFAEVDDEGAACLRGQRHLGIGSLRKVQVTVSPGRPPRRGSCGVVFDGVARRIDARDSAGAIGLTPPGRQWEDFCSLPRAEHGKRTGFAACQVETRRHTTAAATTKPKRGPPATGAVSLAITSEPSLLLVKVHRTVSPFTIWMRRARFTDEGVGVAGRIGARQAGQGPARRSRLADDVAARVDGEGPDPAVGQGAAGNADEVELRGVAVRLCLLLDLDGPGVAGVGERAPDGLVLGDLDERARFTDEGVGVAGRIGARQARQCPVRLPQLLNLVAAHVDHEFQDPAVDQGAAGNADEVELCGVAVGLCLLLDLDGSGVPAVRERAPDGLVLGDLDEARASPMLVLVSPVGSVHVRSVRVQPAAPSSRTT